jgi:DDE family transposase
MEQERPLDLGTYFAAVEDPGIDRTKRHKLLDIIIIAICGMICGAEGWVDIEAFGKAKEEWLKTFLELPNGIPSHTSRNTNT